MSSLFFKERGLVRVAEYVLEVDGVELTHVTFQAEHGRSVGSLTVDLTEDISLQDNAGCHVRAVVD